VVQTLVDNQLRPGAEASRSDAERAGAHLLLAACSRSDRDLDAALVHARAAIAIASGDPIAHYAMAEVQEAAGDAKGALTSVERALELDPRFLQAHHYRGILLGEAGDTEGAVAAFEQALRLDPAHARSWNNLGNAQRTLGRLQEAEHSFARAVAVRPDYPLARFHLARILVNQQKYGEAIQQLLRSLQPEDEQTPLYLFALGAAYARAGDRGDRA
jgi:tetratricopeptide (TPR) repeat protein